MQLLISLIIAAIVAYIAKLLLEMIGIPSPFPMLVALVVFVVLAFGERWGFERPWR
jgi:uncharacterized protein YacL